MGKHTCEGQGDVVGGKGSTLRLGVEGVVVLRFHHPTPYTPPFCEPLYLGAGTIFLNTNGGWGTNDSRKPNDYRGDAIHLIIARYMPDLSRIE